MSLIREFQIKHFVLPAIAGKLATFTAGPHIAPTEIFQGYSVTQGQAWQNT
ncbi:hypothetical protein [Oligosphaera ethanolica]|uniref:Uncharacterized protein n=1 Tax=Oligosphaera ethanolica TaxID=760260 RepID=A0AAE3VFN5_9BACT|nr:hypothetical protein [Oligosphaera ethanolica]MDQ0289595.1 hypothetical protein [Oligosphaera ethanolica]